jgi:hypothetical protein
LKAQEENEVNEEAWREERLAHFGSDARVGRAFFYLKKS